MDLKSLRPPPQLGQLLRLRQPPAEAAHPPPAPDHHQGGQRSSTPRSSSSSSSASNQAQAARHRRGPQLGSTRALLPTVTRCAPRRSHSGKFDIPRASAGRSDSDSALPTNPLSPQPQSGGHAEPSHASESDQALHLPATLPDAWHQLLLKKGTATFRAV